MRLISVQRASIYVCPISTPAQELRSMFVMRLIIANVSLNPIINLKKVMK